MPREGYTNLSIEAKTYDKIRRQFDRMNLEKSFAVWTLKMVETGIKRMDYLDKAYPNLKMLSVVDGGLVLEDKETNKVIKVYRDGNEIKSSDPEPKYIQFALIHPEFRF